MSKNANLKRLTTKIREIMVGIHGKQQRDQVTRGDQG